MQITWATLAKKKKGGGGEGGGRKITNQFKLASISNMNNRL